MWECSVIDGPMQNFIIGCIYLNSKGLQGHMGRLVAIDYAPTVISAMHEAYQSSLNVSFAIDLQTTRRNICRWSS